MDHSFTFDTIRPHLDSEVPAVIERLKNDPAFMQLLEMYFGTLSETERIQKMEAIKTPIQFQETFVYPLMQAILKDSARGLTHSGFEKLDKNERYLFISNHRDIILDSAFLNMLLFEHGFGTTQIAIGNNLLIAPWIEDLVKLNKSFIVRRDLVGRQQLEFSQVLSDYIRTVVSTKKSSVWLAQKQGRTKDGNDITHAGLLKMLDISGKGDFASNFKELKIIPVSISYEFDPCDIKKLWEMTPRGKEVTPEEDLKIDLDNMVAGIKGQKGKIHFHMGNPILAELDELNENPNKNDRFRALASLINQQIYAGYQLHPINYVAADLYLGEPKFKANYTPADTLIFADYIEGQIRENTLEVEDVRKKLVKMYAWSVFNHLGISFEELPQ